MSREPAWAHLSIAEAGERAAVRGDHRTALGHYREAMRLAVSSGAPDVFPRRYLEATMESLEMLNEFESVVAYCELAIEHYREHPPAHPVAWLDLASIHQRHGCVLLKQTQSGPAASPSSRRSRPRPAPLRGFRSPKRSSGWLRRGLVISPERLLAEQRRCRYFSVRPETVEQGPGTP